MWLQRLNRHATHFEIEGCQWEVLGWSYRDRLPSNVPHRHTFFEACLVGSHGEGTFSNDHDQYPLHPGTFFLARPGAVHQIENADASEMELFWVSFSVTQAAKGELGSLLQAFLGSELVFAPAQETLKALWSALLALATKTGPETHSDATSLRLLGQAVLLEIAQVGAGGESRQDALPVEAPELLPVISNHSGLARLGAQYVHDNLERSLTPDEIARHLAVSRRQLTRLFSTYTGVPPALYIERTRIDRARGLLRAGQKPVKEIAMSVGYPDVHHFTRVFTRVVGISPARYRNSGSNLTFKDIGRDIPNAGQLV